MSDDLQPRKPTRFPARRLDRACELEMRQLRAFVAVVDEGSVTAAARALRVAQSTVSEALAALERTLGTSMLCRHRGTHDSPLTPAGQALLPNARELLAGVERTYIAVAEAATQARGHMNIAANESVSTYVLTKPLVQLRARWPNTHFSISVATCADVRHGILDGTFDIGILLQRADPSSTLSSIETHNLIHDDHVLAPLVPLVLFATPAHPLAARKQNIRKCDLLDFVIFVSDPAGEFHDLIQNSLLERGLPTVRLQSAGSVEAVKRGVATDPCALGILPSYAIQEELRVGRVAPIHISPSLPAMQLVALLSRIQKRHPSLSELIDDIRSLLRAPA